MDDKTRDYRRRQKALDRGAKPGESALWSGFGRKSQGRKNKPAERLEVRRCEEIVGGKEAFFKKRRPDNTEYSVRFIKGGVRCAKTAFVKGLCAEHLEARTRRPVKAAPVRSMAKPKRTHIVGGDGKEV
jgi:hypothetical protein